MIELKKKGESHKINLAKKNYASDDKKAHIKLNWKTAVDLDLHAYAITTSDEFIHVFFANKKSPCGNIVLDQDAGVGNTSGDNEENLIVQDVTKIQKVIFVANIFRFFGSLFSSGDKFNNYDGQIIIKTLGEEIRMFLNSEELGRWAVIAMIDNQNGISDFKNINTILKSEPTLDYVKNLS